MKKEVAQQLNQRIKQDLGESKAYSIVETRSEKELTKFHTFANGKPCIGAHLVESAREERLWILVIDWRADGNYYVSVYPERSNKGVYAELHNNLQSGDESQLYWKYSPSKHDGRNSERREAFESLCGGLEMTVSLPGAELTANEFLDDIFVLIQARLAADLFISDPSVLSRTVYKEGRRVWKTHKHIERNSKAAKEAKDAYIERNNGKCPCQLCGFNFEDYYGKIGQGFIEAHHVVPLNTIEEDSEIETKKSDFMMLCANCHRMVHRLRVGESIESLKKVMGSKA